MGLKRRAMLLGLAVQLAACSEPGPMEKPPQTRKETRPAALPATPAGAPVQLPNESNLPLRVNEACGCVRDGECVVLEQVMGSHEVRKLDCRWLEPNRVAQCRFESRFNALHPAPDGKWTELPGSWRPQTLRATLLPDGRWCAG